MSKQPRQSQLSVSKLLVYVSLQTTKLGHAHARFTSGFQNSNPSSCCFSFFNWLMLRSRIREGICDSAHRQFAARGAAAPKQTATSTDEAAARIDRRSIPDPLTVCAHTYLGATGPHRGRPSSSDSTFAQPLPHGVHVIRILTTKMV